jgi:hypothetical protein
MINHVTAGRCSRRGAGAGSESGGRRWCRLAAVRLGVGDVLPRTAVRIWSLRFFLALCPEPVLATCVRTAVQEELAAADVTVSAWLGLVLQLARLILTQCN